MLIHQLYQIKNQRQVLNTIDRLCYYSLLLTWFIYELSPLNESISFSIHINSDLKTTHTDWCYKKSGISEQQSFKKRVCISRLLQSIASVWTPLTLGEQVSLTIITIYWFVCLHAIEYWLSGRRLTALFKLNKVKVHHMIHHKIYVSVYLQHW